MSSEAIHAGVANNAALGAAGGANVLAVFNNQVVCSRNGNLYERIVGAHPSTRGPAAKVVVRAQLIPVILHFHTLGVSVNFHTGGGRSRSRKRYFGSNHT